MARSEVQNLGASYNQAWSISQVDRTWMRDWHDRKMNEWSGRRN